MTTPDRIEREITIDASVERVWSMVTVPGWFIGEDKSGQVRRRSDDLDILEDPRYGTFAIRTVALDPPRYAAYRCAAGERVTDDNSTLLEFWVVAGDGGVLVRVAESGFAALHADEETRRKAMDGNGEAWEREIGNLKARVER